MKPDDRPSEGVTKSELRGMQGVARKAQPLAIDFGQPAFGESDEDGLVWPVDLVAHQGKADRGEMGTDLVLAPGSRGAAQEGDLVSGCIPVAAEHVDLGDGRFARSNPHAYPHTPVSKLERQVDDEGLFCGPALGNRKVALLNLAVCEGAFEQC
jgi:hypothetical protein